MPPIRDGRNPNPWWPLLALSLGQVMVILDVTILNVALPAIAADLHAAMDGLEWVLISYSLTMVALVPLFGRMSDVWGRKRLYLYGLWSFTAASALAAMAGSVWMLIGARMLQAAGGALITANTLALLTDLFPDGKRGMAMGLQSILISGGAALGPALGGVLVTHFGWEAVFLVNLPIGVGGAWLAASLLPSRARKTSAERVDLLGAGLLILGLLSFLVALTQAPARGWTAPSTLLLFALSLPAFSAFAFWQGRARYPLVRPALLRNWPFLAGQLAGGCSTLVLVGVVFLMPFYWQALRQFSAQTAGLLMLPTPLGLMAMAAVGGKLSDRLDARTLPTLGLLMVAVGVFLVGGVGPQTAVVDVMGRLGLTGMGLGLFIAPNNNAVMAVVPAADRGVAAGLLALSRFTGQALGIALTGTLFLIASGHAGQPELLTAEGFRIPPGPELAALEADFVTGLHATCMMLVPVCLVGAALSLFRGSPPSPARARPTAKVAATPVRDGCPARSG